VSFATSMNSKCRRCGAEPGTFCVGIHQGVHLERFLDDDAVEQWSRVMRLAAPAETGQFVMKEERVKTMSLPQFLTAAQIRVAAVLYAEHGMDAVAEIQAQVIEPNMTAINAKLGQENDARYLAYAVVYVLSQVSEPDPEDN
jgi:hypothetical protein